MASLKWGGKDREPLIALGHYSRTDRSLLSSHIYLVNCESPQASWKGLSLLDMKISTIRLAMAAQESIRFFAQLGGYY